MNRETWLNQMAELMRPRFEALGFPIPKFRISIGFTSGGQRSNAQGECWNAACSEDHAFEILVAPDLTDPVQLCRVVAHELTHAAVGFECGHKGVFAKVCTSLGFLPPMTQTPVGPIFEAWVAPFIEKLGPIPHARLVYDRMPEAAPVDPRTPGSEVPEQAPAPRIGGRPSTAKPKQGTRLKKAECSQCGYTVRVTARWLEIGPPHCPVHGAMDVDVDIPEGAEDDAA